MSSNPKREVFEELIREVRRSQTATDRFDQAVADALGLNRTDMRCLDVLEREGAVTAGRLAEATGLTSGAMTTALDRLERAGYAERVRDVEDRRRVLVRVTPAAQAEAGSYYTQHEALSEELYRNYTTEQMQMLLAFVRRGREFNERRAGEVEASLRDREPGRTRGRSSRPGQARRTRPRG
jgi:DNA-binding MarR family transcriptional regulator